MLVRDWFRRVLPYLGRGQAEADLREELRLHVELERERLRDTGVPDGEAARAARRRLGNATLIRERTRDVWGWRWLDDLGRDVRHALRGLRRNAAFTATVVCVLAAGIGANSAMFGIVHAMLVRPLPYPDAGAIVRVGEQQLAVQLTSITLPRLQAEAGSFEQIAAYRTRAFDWDGPEGRTALSGAWVSPSLFPLLRARPRLGRLFTETDARAEAEPVALLGHGAWTRRFGSSPDVVGMVLPLDGTPHAVVGVPAEGFRFPTPDQEVWTPWVMPSAAPTGPGGRPAAVQFFEALGRLRPGVSPEQATTEVRTILQGIDSDFMRRLRRSDGDAPGDSPQVDARVIPLQEDLVGGYRRALLALTAAVALVLLIACSNVAGLLLARGVARRRELALRAALGAGRGRVVRQLLTESVVLGVGGGLVGLAAATGVLRAVPAIVPGYVARLHEVGVDGTVLAFTLGLSVLVGLAFGAAPAFQWSGTGLVGTLNEGSPRAAGGFRLLRSSRTRAALAAGQAALAIMLLVGAGLLLRTFVGLVTIDRGYDPANVVTARTRNPDRAAPNRPFTEALLAEMQGMARHPDVAAVGLSSGLPLAYSAFGAAMRAPGRPAPSGPLFVQVVSPGYFDVMRLRLRSGRLFTRLDEPRAPGVVVVNETFAREVFDGAPAVGRQVLFGEDPLEVIGVVADILYSGLGGSESPAEAYLSVPHPRFSFRPYISVRTTGDPSEAVPLLREAAAAAHPARRSRT